MSTHQEKRLYPRTEVKWSAALRTAGGQISCETVNITVEGALIRCAEVPGSTEPLEIFLNVPSLVQPLALTAQVIHANISNQGDESTPCEIGVRFIGVSDKNRWLISTAIQRESGAMLMP
jgi:hypothetical protein